MARLHFWFSFLFLTSVLTTFPASCQDEDTVDSETRFIPIHTIDNTDDESACPSDDAQQAAYIALNEDVEDIVSGRSIRPCSGPEWRRVAFLNMSDPNENCPNALLETRYSIRTCGRAISHNGYPSCWGTLYDTNGTYSRVCGRAIAYHWGRQSGFDRGRRINDVYLDGLSLTYGQTRSHIWSFGIGWFEGHEVDNAYVQGMCPCDSAYRNAFTPSFVGNDYFCESGATSQSIANAPNFYSDDPLWDGKNCPISRPKVGYTCCDFNTPPWFIKDLPNPTTDGIEVRLCSRGVSQSSDVALQLLEIYVQ